MIEKFLKMLRGFVLISVTGGQPERFLNLCAARRISMERIRRSSDTELTVRLSLRDFFLLRPIRSKTNVHIRVLEKRGLPFFFYRNKKRKAFFLGILLFLFLMPGLSGHIWNIHIQGNVRNTTPELLEFLRERGVTHGMAKGAVDCGQIAADLRKKYPEITWVSARIEGTRLLLEMQEGISLPQPETQPKPCSLTSHLDGTIVTMITRKGVPLKRPGDSCRRGELLISGELPVRNDSQEIVRVEQVQADGDIYVRHPLSYYHSFPLKQEVLIPTEKQRKGFFFRIGRRYFGFYPKAGQNSRRIATERQLFLTENFALPISVGRVELTACRKGTCTYTREQAEELSTEALHRFEERLLEKGVQIVENRVSVSVTKDACTARGVLTVIEKTGVPAPVQGRLLTASPEV